MYIRTSAEKSVGAEVISVSRKRNIQPRRPPRAAAAMFPAKSDEKMPLEGPRRAVGPVGGYDSLESFRRVRAIPENIISYIVFV